MQCGLVIARQRSGAALAEVMAVYQPIHKHVEGAAADSKEQRWDTAEAVLLAAGRSDEDQTTALSCERAVEVRGAGAGVGAAVQRIIPHSSIFGPFDGYVANSPSRRERSG